MQLCSDCLEMVNQAALKSASFFKKYPYCIPKVAPITPEEVIMARSDSNFRFHCRLFDNEPWHAQEHISRVRAFAKHVLSEESLWPLLIYVTLRLRDRELWASSHIAYKRRVLAALDTVHAHSHPEVLASVPSGNDMETHFVDTFSCARVGRDELHAEQGIAEFESKHPGLIQMMSTIDASYTSKISSRFARSNPNWLAFKVRHWSTKGDEQYLRCEASALFETVRKQFKVGPHEDMAIYYFPPVPSVTPVRVKLSYDRISEIEHIGHLVRQPMLYLHTIFDNINN